MADWLEVYAGIFSIREKTYRFFQPGVNIFYIPCNDGGLLFDAGYSMPLQFNSFIKSFTNLVRHLKKNGRLTKGIPLRNTISRIIISHEHFDHASGIHFLSRYFPAAEILMSRETKEQLEGGFHSRDRTGGFKGMFGDRLKDFITSQFYKLSGVKKLAAPVTIVNNGVVIDCCDFTLRLIITGGHSKGQIIALDESRGVLFSSDLILKSISTWLGPPNSDYGDYLSIMNELAGVENLTILLPAHGQMIGEPRERIRELLRFRRLRELQIKKACEKPMKISSIAWKLYRERGLGTVFMATGMVEVVVRYLVKKGELREIKGRHGSKFTSRVG
ncbi:MAG: MBL fold metallo-hydrolase [Promethearchaeota archaeon]